MVRMNDPYPKRKCPARRLSKFLGSDTTNRILAWVGTFAVSLTARELFRWLINVMRHCLRVLHFTGRLSTVADHALPWSVVAPRFLST